MKFDEEALRKKLRQKLEPVEEAPPPARPPVKKVKWTCECGAVVESLGKPIDDICPKCLHNKIRHRKPRGRPV